MKKLVSIILLTAFIFYLQPAVISAQQNDAAAVKTVLKNILDLSKSKSYDKLAAYVAYNGDNKSRLYKTTYDPKVKDELIQVQRVGRKISALISLSDNYSISKTEVSKIEGVDGYKVVVNFKSGEQSLETSFEFIKLDSGYALFDIN